jgi:hypothetical protein
MYMRRWVSTFSHFRVMALKTSSARAAFAPGSAVAHAAPMPRRIERLVIIVLPIRFLFADASSRRIPVGSKLFFVSRECKSLMGVIAFTFTIGKNFLSGVEKRQQMPALKPDLNSF